MFVFLKVRCTIKVILVFKNVVSVGFCDIFWILQNIFLQLRSIVVFNRQQISNFNILIRFSINIRNKFWKYHFGFYGLPVYSNSKNNSLYFYQSFYDPFFFLKKVNFSVVVLTTINIDCKLKVLSILYFNIIHKTD